jgi:hypothetical protein
VLALAFVLTSTVLYWLPYLREKTGWYDTGSGYVPPYSSTYYPPYTSTYYPPFDAGFTDYSLRDLKKLTPAAEREVLDQISSELKQKSNAELFQMRAFTDVCGNGLVNCRGLKTTTVKPFIDAVLSDRQIADTAWFARTANWIAAGSLFVSFLALTFTGLSYQRGRTAKIGVKK